MGCNCDKFVFQPPKSKNRQEITLFLKTRRQNQIPAIFLDRAQEFTLLISHGNAEDISHVLEWSRRRLMHSVCVNIMIYEYTGYFSRKSRPSEQGVYADCEAALEYLTQVQNIPEDKIILYGRSLGTGPTCFLAEKYSNLAGIILQSPLMSIYRVILEFKFTFPGDMFSNIDRMKQITCPTLFIHGTRDEVIPMHHSKKMYKLCASKLKYLYFVEGGGHNNIEYISSVSFYEVIQAFIDKIAGASDYLDKLV